LRLFLIATYILLPFFAFTQDKITTEGLPGSVNSSTQDVRPVISDDGKKIFLTRRFHPENIRGDKDFQDVWVSQLDSRGIWTKPKNMGEKYNDKRPNDLVRASKNDDSLIFVNSRYKGINSELALFKKGKSDPIELPIDGFYNKSNYVDYDYNFKNNIIIMAVERSDTEGDQDLYFSIYDETTGRFTTPKSMGKALNSEKADFAPFLTNDGYTIFFASYGHGGQGSADLFMSHRTGGWDDWSEPENLGNVINTKFEETYVSIDPSFNYLYYDSYPPGASNRNIWRATLSDEIKNKITAAKERKQNKPAPPPVTQQEKPIQEPEAETSLTENNLDETSNDTQEEITEADEVQQPPVETEEVIAENPVPISVKIDREMDYVKEQERNNKGFLSTLGNKLGFGEDEEINLIDAGAKGQKINRNIYFKFDSEKVLSKFDMLLDEITAILEEKPQLKILLEGHTDAIGGEDINIDLSCKRSNNVKEALIERGINQYRIEISCEGKERPIATNDDEFEGRELNRRVEFYLF